MLMTSYGFAVWMTEVLFMHKQLINLKFRNHGALEFLTTFSYGRGTPTERKSMWDDIHNLVITV